MKNLNILIVSILIIISFNCSNKKSEIPSDMHLSQYTKYEYNSKKLLIAEYNYDVLKRGDSLTSISNLEYNTKGENIKRIEIKNKETTISYIMQFDSNGNKISVIGYDKANKMFYKSLNVVNEKKQYLFSSNYDSNGKLLSKVKNQFNKEGDLCLSTYLDSLDNILSKDSIVWIDKFYKKEYEIKNGNIMLLFESKSDNKDNHIKRIDYDTHGKISETLLKDRSPDGMSSVCKFLDKNGNIKTIALDFYDKNGLIIKTEWYNK